MFVAEERNRLSKVKRQLLVEFKALEGYSPETRDMTLEFILKWANSLAYYVDLTTDDGQRTKKEIEGFFAITSWSIPVNIFSDKKEAVDWLRQHVVK